MKTPRKDLMKSSRQVDKRSMMRPRLRLKELQARKNFGSKSMNKRERHLKTWKAILAKRTKSWRPNCCK